MTFEIRDDCRYLVSHEWACRHSGSVRVGISDFAQDELGDVVFVELPSENATLDRKSDFGVVESIKAVSDIYAPVSGTVSATNDALIDQPELVNEDPYGDGWMIELEDVTDSEFDSLLSPAQYREQIR
jgi:glycine cleavage system H protein